MDFILIFLERKNPHSRDKAATQPMTAITTPDGSCLPGFSASGPRVSLETVTEWLHRQGRLVRGGLHWGKPLRPQTRAGPRWGGGTRSKEEGLSRVERNSWDCVWCGGRRLVLRTRNEMTMALGTSRRLQCTQQSVHGESRRDESGYQV